MDENQKRSWMLATLLEDIQNYVPDRADALEREHGVDLDENDRARAQRDAAKPAGADMNANERQAGADEVATAILPDLHKVAGLIAVAPGLAHSALLELIADLANPLEVFNKRALQARTESAKEHARMVREVLEDVGTLYDLAPGARVTELARRIEKVAQAIEKGAK